MRYCFIINPASGKLETKEGLDERIRSACEKRELDFDILHTQKAGDAKEYIPAYCKEHRGEDIRFYACGGDGTLCEAVNGVMTAQHDGDVSLGVVPVGTGNDFVRNFGEKETFLDIEAQLDAKNERVDVIGCNDFYALNMINIGFDCQVVVSTGGFKKKKFVPSGLAYIFGLVATLIKKPGAHMYVSADGDTAVEKSLLLATFANSCYCGGGFHSNPNACLNDGKINALFVNNISRTRFIGLVGSYKKGTHINEKNADILSDSKASEYKITFDGMTNVSVDGEIVKAESLTLRCIPSVLDFLVPQKDK